MMAAEQKQWDAVPLPPVPSISPLQRGFNAVRAKVNPTKLAGNKEGIRGPIESTGEKAKSRDVNAPVRPSWTSDLCLIRVR